jgi:hypothetical protein
MSSWALLEAASGYSYDAASNAIGFAPVLSAERFRAPFVARDGWGTFEQVIADGRLEARLRLAAGTLMVTSIRLRPPVGATGRSVTVDGRDIAARTSGAGRDVTVVLDEPTSIAAGQQLAVALTG